MKPLSQKTTILGAGLLGGSLGMALRQRGLAKEVHAWSPSERTRKICEKSDWCSAVYRDAAVACEGADLVFLCGPVDTIPPLLEEIAPSCGEGCLLTDVGSTKARISETGSRVFPSSHAATFIGSHPMAGSEKSGLQYADPHLFLGKTCIITPTNQSSGPLQRLLQIWKELGMETFECSPAEHDRIVAHMSHLPHGLAAILCAVLADLPDDWAACAGNGLRDTTRVAAGDPKLWTAIFRDNETAFRESLKRIQVGLDEMHAALDSPDNLLLDELLGKAREYRVGLEEKDLQNE